MISILIPTYNYDVTALVETLDKELRRIEIDYEILLRDDASTREVPQNEAVAQLKNVLYSRASKNAGRTATRQWLAQQAKYDHLLFLDADVLPKYETFVWSYLSHPEYDILFGGICYQEKVPADDKVLRWSYGRAREMLSMEERSSKPYLTINSGCFRIRKDLFLRVNQKLQLHKYGLDNYFKELLRNLKATVLHIDNPVYHLGLEDNSQFLRKSLEAIDTTLYLESRGLLGEHARPLQQSYQKLKRFGLSRIFSWFIRPWKSIMERNFMGKNPNLFWFDLYRLQYYIQQKRRGNA